MNPSAQLFSCASRIFNKDSLGRLPDFHFRIAGRSVCLRFEREERAKQLCRTFRHLQVPLASLPDLTIWILEPSSCPEAFRGSLDTPSGGGVLHYSRSPQCAVYLATRLVEAYDAQHKIGLLSLPPSGAIDPGYLAAPFQNIFHWWSAGQQLQLVHGGAVGSEYGAAILAGRGGSGKSTTVLGCIGAGLKVLSDDYCLVDVGKPSVVYSLYGSSKVDAHSRAMLRHFRGVFEPAVTDAAGKSICYLAECTPEVLMSNALLRAIIVPQAGSSTTCEAVPVSSAEALRALAPSTIFQLLGNRTHSLQMMANIVRNVPCWRLELGPDPHYAQALISNIIKSGTNNLVS